MSALLNQLEHASRTLKARSKPRQAEAVDMARATLDAIVDILDGIDTDEIDHAIGMRIFEQLHEAGIPPRTPDQYIRDEEEQRAGDPDETHPVFY